MWKKSHNHLISLKHWDSPLFIRSYNIDVFIHTFLLFVKPVDIYAKNPK